MWLFSLQGIFQRTWDYYGYLTEQIVEALKASRRLWTDLVSRCHFRAGWVANDNGTFASSRDPEDDCAINLFSHDVAPDCEVGLLDYTRSSYMKYADRHDLIGGDSNKCLQNFVVRYNDYDEKVYETFVGELHKFLFQDLTVYGMCMTFDNASNDERVRRKEWVNEKLTTISSQLLKVREVFEEAAFCRWTTKVSAFWSNFTCLQQEAVPTPKKLHSIVEDAMILNGNGIKNMPVRERPTRYQGLIEYIVHKVEVEYTKFAENGSIEGVMYLPYGESDKSLYCALDWPDNANHWTEHPTPPEVLRSRVAFLKDRSNEDATWDTIFNEYNEELCVQVRKMMHDTTLTRNGSYLGLTDSKESSGFTAVIAVRCTNEFVWYELGWRYYNAAATTASDYVVSRYDGEYTNSCGQLIFLP